MDSSVKLELTRLKPLSADSWPDESMHFGIAVQVADPSTQQFHTSTLYRFDGRLMVGEVQSHLRSRKAMAKPSAGVYWIAPDLALEEQRVLASKVDAWLDENHGRIPYSVAHPGGVIFKDDVWIGNEPGQGLTCATFVIALFDELGIPFIDIESWEDRPGDSDWAARILQMLKPYMTDEHFSAQKQRLGQSVRVRPSDVTAAGLLVNQNTDVALQFKEVAPLAGQVEVALLTGAFR